MSLLYLYHLIDSACRVRYFGVTADTARRLSQHLRSATRKRTPVAVWIGDEVRGGRLPRIVTVGTIAAGESWREVERQEIWRLWADGQPVLNHQGTLRSQFAGSEFDDEVRTIRWATRRIKLLRAADAWAEHEGRATVMSHVPTEFPAEFNYLIFDLRWTPGGKTDRMFRRLELSRRRDWFETALIDDMGLCYPPSELLSGGPSWMPSDERSMSADDYQRSIDFAGTMARRYMWLENENRRRAAAKGFDLGTEKWPGRDTLPAVPPQLCVPSQGDDRFDLMEHVRWAIVDKSPVVVQLDDGTYRTVA